MGIIYKVTSPSGKVYIGKTLSDLGHRQRQHKHEAYKKRNGKYFSNNKFHRAIRKYGFENLVWEVLHIADDVNSLEEMEIKRHNSCTNGYNIEKGAIGGPRSEETKRKISESLKGHSPFAPREAFMSQLGKKRPSEIKKKISDTMKRKGLNPQMWREK